MKTITLRRIPRDLARIIEERARARGLSLARTVLELCEEVPESMFRADVSSTEMRRD